MYVGAQLIAYVNRYVAALLIAIAIVYMYNVMYRRGVTHDHDHGHGIPDDQLAPAPMALPRARRAYTVQPKFPLQL